MITELQKEYNNYLKMFKSNYYKGATLFRSLMDTNEIRSGLLSNAVAMMAVFTDIDRSEADRLCYDVFIDFYKNDTSFVNPVLLTLINTVCGTTHSSLNTALSDTATRNTIIKKRYLLTLLPLVNTSTECATIWSDNTYVNAIYEVKAACVNIALFTLSNDTSWSAFTSNSTAVSKLKNSTELMDTLLDTSTSLSHVVSSSACMTVLASSEYFMRKVAANNTYMNAIGSSQTAVNAISAAMTQTATYNGSATQSATLVPKTIVFAVSVYCSRSNTGTITNFYGPGKTNPFTESKTQPSWNVGEINFTNSIGSRAMQSKFTMNTADTGYYINYKYFSWDV